MNPQISIIVPIYNVEAYLHRCIDSLLGQTFQDYEILLIDDGSSDKSGVICDEYALRDYHIRVFHKENEGISATREFGILNATGEYIQFIDSDDWIEPSMFEDMYNIATKKDADIVGCDFYEVFPNSVVQKEFSYTSKDNYIKDIISGNWAVVWRHLIRRSLFVENDIHFPKGINGGEDYVVCVKCFTKAENIYNVNKALYNYNRCNENSIMSTTNIVKIQYQIDATKIIDNYLERNNIKQKYTIELNIRKFWSKYPMLKKNPLVWMKIFPECDYIYKYTNCGIKAKILLFILLKFQYVRSLLT